MTKEKILFMRQRFQISDSVSDEMVIKMTQDLTASAQYDFDMFRAKLKDAILLKPLFRKLGKLIKQ